MPSICEYPCATNLALFLTIIPCSSCLFLNIHFVPIKLRQSFGFSTNFHTLFLSKLLSSLCIDSNQYESSRASHTFFGSIMEMCAWCSLNLFNCSLVEIPFLRSPTTFWREWSLNSNILSFLASRRAWISVLFLGGPSTSF